ncbi:EcoKI restriction-modification system protein HsdS [bacterium BMS3Abin03]|nr:EcoKI restriction-modification system protein HsdS [bacterium BMS3Abin03]
MKVKLKDIANIQTGLFARTASGGDVVYLKAKHFDQNGKLKTRLHPDLKLDSAAEKHLLKRGDVLYAAKGTKNFASWYESGNQPAVASTSFFVIRLTNNWSDKILPEFLVWSLNHPVTQRYLKGKAIGTAIVSISKSVLEDTEISIPDIQIQKAVLKITQLRNTEIKLKDQIETLREKQIQQQILNGIK